MKFSVSRPWYFISHTTSQRSPVTRYRLSCEKVNLYSTFVTWAWDACGIMSYRVTEEAPSPTPTPSPSAERTRTRIRRNSSSSSPIWIGLRLTWYQLPAIKFNASTLKFVGERWTPNLDVNKRKQSWSYLSKVLIFIFLWIKSFPCTT